MSKLLILCMALFFDSIVYGQNPAQREWTTQIDSGQSSDIFNDSIREKTQERNSRNSKDGALLNHLYNRDLMIQNFRTLQKIKSFAKIDSLFKESYPYKVNLVTPLRIKGFSDYFVYFKDPQTNAPNDSCSGNGKQLVGRISIRRRNGIKSNCLLFVKKSFRSQLPETDTRNILVKKFKTNQFIINIIPFFSGLDQTSGYGLQYKIYPQMPFLKQPNTRLICSVGVDALRPKSWFFTSGLLFNSELYCINGILNPGTIPYFTFEYSLVPKLAFKNQEITIGMSLKFVRQFSKKAGNIYPYSHMVNIEPAKGASLYDQMSNFIDSYFKNSELGWSSGDIINFKESYSNSPNIFVSYRYKNLNVVTGIGRDKYKASCTLSAFYGFLGNPYSSNSNDFSEQRSGVTTYLKFGIVF